MASREADWHLFIIDNGSTDNSASELSDLGPDSTFVETGVNGGWAGGNNQGINLARSKGFEWFLFLNNDAKVEPLTIKELFDSSNFNGKVPAIVGAIQLDSDEESCFYGTREPDHSVFPVAINREEFDRLPDRYATSYVKGAALFCHVSHIVELGLFDERFFLNYEETEWCRRARRAGLQVMMEKKAVVYHRGSGSMGGVSSPISTYFLVRNALLYAEMHSGLNGVVEGLRSRLQWARSHFGTRSGIVAITRTMRSRSGWAIAWKLGIRDYFLRRFGDCPQIIRTLTYSR